MVHDTIANLRKYASLHRALGKVCDFLECSDLKGLGEGRIDLEGDDLFALVQKYRTAAESEKLFETHSRYMDIQCLVAGEELMGYAPTETLEPAVPYDQGKDIAFYGRAPMSTSLVREGTFTLYFPGEAHMPGCSLRGKGSREVRKIVFKVKI